MSQLTIIAPPVVENQNNSKEETRLPKMWEVILHNDHSTGPDFVIRVLNEVFNIDGVNAKRIMMKAHTSGNALVRVMTKEMAETLIARADAYAAQAERGYDFGSHAERCELTFSAQEQ